MWSDLIDTLSSVEMFQKPFIYGGTGFGEILEAMRNKHYLNNICVAPFIYTNSAFST